MNIKNDLFINRIKEYFGDNYSLLLNNIENGLNKSFFLNLKKTDKNKILSLCDFKYEINELNDNVYNYEDISISKHIINDLGLIYPQDVASTIGAKYINKNSKLVLDFCAAPGGKSINILNNLD